MANESSTSLAPGTLVAWEEGIGDDKKYHIAHIAPTGITLVCKLQDHSQWETLVAAAKRSRNDAATMLRQLPEAVHLAPDEISRVTYAEQLWQLTIFDRKGRKTKVPDGKEQAQVFAAMSEHFGGAASEEEADAWAVMKTPLFVLAVIGVIGGFFIWFTAICEPEIEATGRRQGLQVFLNWLGYAIGPVWMSVAVGSLAALVLVSMILQLIKRPIRQVLTYSS